MTTTEKSEKTGVSARSGDKSLQVIHEVTYEPILPPPEDLERYEAILPGSAERLMVMAEKQQTHLVAQKDANSDQNYSLATRGQWLVAGLCFCFAAIAVLGIFYDAPQTAYFAVAAAVGVIAISAIARNKK